MIIYLQMIDTPENQSKFEKLYYAYRDVMYQAAYKILHNEYDAEDAVHQAFLKVVEIIDDVDETLCSRTKSFMIIITERKALDILRYNKHHPTFAFDDELGLIVEYEGPNELTFYLSKLPAIYRQVLLLKHYHGYSSAETAKLLDRSEANIIKIDQRAKKKLKLLYTEGNEL